MRNKVVLAVGGCIAAVFTQTVSAYAAPVAPGLRVVSTGPGASSPQVFTLRYVAFIAQPKDQTIAALDKGLPPLLKQGLNLNTRYAMTATPEDFIGALQTDLPGYTFKVSLVGSAVLPNSNTKTLVSNGPNPSDQLALMFKDTISVSQNSATTLDFASEGWFAYRSPGAPESTNVFDREGWRGENKELTIGRTYLWGANGLPDGTCVTWALCILPGRIDQMASIWKRLDGTRERIMASDKASKRTSQRGQGL